ncbi:MAG: type II toxin-antitoxin system VapC family toxin [Acidobacteria bacterium]|nr:type II toxin-antitoxin system VapC family toxin [Acidobacteriota bacterium]
MVIDSSAVLAILLGEPERESFFRAIHADPVRLICAVNALESSTVIENRKGPSGGRELDLFIHRAGIEIVALTEAHFETARRAWRRFGKGNHPAALNIGDCCAYALSKTSGEPLLFKGADFVRTDVAIAPLP